MKCLTILFWLIFWISKSYCQLTPEFFSPKGSMSELKLSIDTLLHVKFTKTDTIIRFAKIDTSRVSDIALKNKLAAFLSVKTDSLYDYFFIYNTTANPISMGYRFNNNSLNGIQLAKTSNNEFRPISLIVIQRCCLDCTNKIIRQGDILIFKMLRPSFKVQYLTQSKLKLSNNLISESFYTSIDQNAFYINSIYFNDVMQNRYRFTFLDKR